MDESIGFQMVSEAESSPGSSSSSSSEALRHSLQERANAEQTLRSLQRELLLLTEQQKWTERDIPKYWRLKETIARYKNEYIYKVVDNDN